MIKGEPRRIAVDAAAVEHDAEIGVAVVDDRLDLSWSADARSRLHLSFALESDQPLLREISLSTDGSASPTAIAAGLRPHLAITAGSRSLATPGGWIVFFDSPYQRPHVRHVAELRPTTVSVVASGNRATVSFDGLRAGPFAGRLEFTVYADSPLIHMEAVVRTDQDGVAFVYEAGLVAGAGISGFVLVDPKTDVARAIEAGVVAGPVAARYRTVVAATIGGGSIAAFPPPHQFFYPLDIIDNFGFNWLGTLEGPDGGSGWGIHQPPEGDRRDVPWGQAPWVNAPPGTEQRLGLFLLVAGSGPEVALEAVKAYTHGDRYVRLPGHVTFTSHYHVEHTLSLLLEVGGSAPPAEAADLEPAFVRAFKAHGVDIVHLTEFHKKDTPILGVGDRLLRLELLHSECRRWSKGGFLVLPGEEPNVHLGGHWVSLFPKPIYWVLNRTDEQPFAQQLADGRTLYRVGNAADVLALMEREQGYMWTSHPRIKDSQTEPDSYRHTPFYQSDRFVGAGWKPMPADFSKDRLGTRALELFDDMLGWARTSGDAGPPGEAAPTDPHRQKRILGEVDCFRVEPGYELYGHGNINYIRLDQVPEFDDGWQEVGDALANGAFFVTTGEILIHACTGEARPGGPFSVRAELSWTFPLAFAEVIAGYPDGTRHTRLDLSRTAAFGSAEIELSIPPQDLLWWRFEAWDVAHDGAFTQAAQMDVFGGSA